MKNTYREACCACLSQTKTSRSYGCCSGIPPHNPQNDSDKRFVFVLAFIGSKSMKPPSVVELAILRSFSLVTAVTAVTAKSHPRACMLVGAGAVPITNISSRTQPFYPGMPCEFF